MKKIVLSMIIGILLPTSLWAQDLYGGLQGMNADVYTIGTTDYSNGWWEEFSKYYVIQEGDVWNAQFNLHIAEGDTEPYHNFALLLTNDADRDDANYREYGALRFDTNDGAGNSEWGDYIDRSKVTSTLLLSPTDDANVQQLAGKVTLTVDRSQTGNFVVRMINKNGVEKVYDQGSALVNLNADSLNTAIRAFLVIERSYIDFFATNIEPIGGYTAAVDEPYASLSDDNSTLSFYYDGYRFAREGSDVLTFDTNKYGDDRSWASVDSLITTVVFDSSFSGYTGITSTENWFYNCRELSAITGLENLNTQNVTTMRHMFYDCQNLTAIDLSYFNTANVTDMGAMFYNCTSLSELDLGSFNTSQVERMDSMFNSCSGLRALDLGNFNTPRLWDMNMMFSGCSSLTSLNVSSFNTSNVTNMQWLFMNCSGLTTLDVRNFNTSNVYIMHQMFWGCSSLTSLDVSGFDTSNSSYMYGMFCDCSSLTTLNVRNFNTSRVTSMGYMFSGCYGLTTLDISSFNTSNVTAMNGMFQYDYQLTTIYVGDGWDTSAVTNGTDMFFNCQSIVGASGTTFVANLTGTGLSYAHVDAGPEWPGYLTDINGNIPPIPERPEYGGDPIQFEDALVEQLCLENWDFNGDGTLTTGEAAAVTDIGQVFFNQRIVSFNEFRYFTGLTAIPYEAFHFSSLRTIDIPSNIRDIGNMAFDESAISSLDGGRTTDMLVIPEGVVYLGEAAFWDNRLFTAVSIPASVTNIGYGCFGNCPNLTTIVVDQANPYYSAVDGVLVRDNSTIVAYPNGRGTSYTIPEGIQDIMTYAFYPNSITELTLPASLSNIERETFWSATTITEYATVPPILGENVFNEDNYTNATLFVPAGTKAAYETADVWRNFQNIVEMGSNATFDGLTAIVSEGGTLDEALNGVGRDVAAQTISAIIWENDYPLTAEMMEGITNPNLLIYVRDASYAPEGFNNIIVNGVAQSIILVDVTSGNGNFYCPQAFTAQEISYARNFSQRTQIGISQGWESIALPFDVQSVTHESGWAMAPFGVGTGVRNFWLRQMSGQGLVSATQIEANKGYVISMPNCDEYQEGYNMPGQVTFAARNVVVPVTEPIVVSNADSTLTLVPAFQRVEQSADVYALNVGETRGGYPEGSVFERAYRDVRPFEAYSTHGTAPTRARYMTLKGMGADNSDVTTGLLNEGGLTGNDEVVKVYNLSGVLVRQGKRQDALNGLSKGVYVVNGRRLTVR